MGQKRCKTKYKFNLNYRDCVPESEKIEDIEEMSPLDDPFDNFKLIRPVVPLPISKKSVLDNYTEIKSLGKGGFGKIVLAKHKKTGELVSIKYQLYKGESNDNLFLEEIHNLKYISDKCKDLICIIDYDVIPGAHVIITEYIDGKNVRQLLDELWKGNTDIRNNQLKFFLENLLKEFFRIIKKLHVMNIAHQDIKPENIMITKNGTIKFIDFGISCIKDLHNDKCITGGTYGYVLSDIYDTITSSIPLKLAQKSDLYAIGQIALEFSQLLDLVGKVDDNNYESKHTSSKIILD